MDFAPELSRIINNYSPREWRSILPATGDNTLLGASQGYWEYRGLWNTVKQTYQTLVASLPHRFQSSNVYFGIEVEVVPGITAALAGAASLQQSLTLRGVSRSVAFITLAQANEGNDRRSRNQPILNPTADTLVYYMGRKDAAKIAQQLIKQSLNGGDTPVHVLEAVSTPRERLWSSTLGELAEGKANDWFDSSSPALIMVGEALRAKELQSKFKDSRHLSTKIDNGLQHSQILTNSMRCA